VASWDNISLGGPPSAADYRSPLVDFRPLADLPKRYYEAQEMQRQNDLKNAFSEGLPKDAAGNPDFRAIMETLARKGGIENIVPLANVDLQRQGLALGQQAAGAMSGGGVVPTPTMPIATAAPSQPPRPPVMPQRQPINGYTGGDNGDNTVASIVSTVMPAENAGPTIIGAAQKLGVDPNQPLTPLQVAQLKRSLPSGAASGQPVAPVDPYADMKRLAPQTAQAPRGGTPGAVAEPTLGGLVPQPFINRYGPAAAAGEYVRWLRGAAVALGSAGQKGAEDAYNKQADAIATALQKASEPTPAQKEAAQMGLDPIQYERSKTMENKVAGEEGESIGEYIKAGRAAFKRVEMLDIMGDALKRGEGKMTTGPFAELALKSKQFVQNLTKNFGWEFEGLQPAEIVSKMGFSLATQTVKEITNRPTQLEVKQALENNPGLLLSEKGSQFMISILKQTARQDADIAKLLQRPENRGRWLDTVENYYKDHPVISPFTGKAVSAKDIEIMSGGQGKAAGGQGGATAQPASGAVVTTKAQYDALPSGATFVDQQGKQWQKP